MGLSAACETFTWIWPAPAEGISTSASLRLAMVSAGLPSAPYAEACQAFMVGMFIAEAVVVKRAGCVKTPRSRKPLESSGIGRFLLNECVTHHVQVVTGVVVVKLYTKEARG